MIYQLEIAEGRSDEFLNVVQGLQKSRLVKSCKKEALDLSYFVGDGVPYSKEMLSELMKTAEADITAGRVHTTEEIMKIFSKE